MSADATAPDPDGRYQPGKFVGALLFFVAVPAVGFVSWMAALVDYRLGFPAGLLAAVAAPVLIRRYLGRRAMIGFFIAFGVAIVVVGGACIALLAALSNIH